MQQKGSQTHILKSTRKKNKNKNRKDPLDYHQQVITNNLNQNFPKYVHVLGKANGGKSKQKICREWLKYFRWEGKMNKLGWLTNREAHGWFK